MLETTIRDQAEAIIHRLKSKTRVTEIEVMGMCNMIQLAHSELPQDLKIKLQIQLLDKLDTVTSGNKRSYVKQAKLVIQTSYAAERVAALKSKAEAGTRDKQKLKKAMGKLFEEMKQYVENHTDYATGRATATTLTAGLSLAQNLYNAVLFDFLARKVHILQIPYFQGATYYYAAAGMADCASYYANKMVSSVGAAAQNLMQVSAESYNHILSDAIRQQQVSVASRPAVPQYQTTRAEQTIQVELPSAVEGRNQPTRSKARSNFAKAFLEY